MLTPQRGGGCKWLLQRDQIGITDKAVFAPANLRATSDNEEYQKLMQYWMSNKYTLRYSGGMVPDIHHILTKVSVVSMPRQVMPNLLSMYFPDMHSHVKTLQPVILALGCPCFPLLTNILCLKPYVVTAFVLDQAAIAVADRLIFLATGLNTRQCLLRGAVIYCCMHIAADMT